jgi:hypothetical protein
MIIQRIPFLGSGIYVPRHCGFDPNGAFYEQKSDFEDSKRFLYTMDFMPDSTL